MATYTVNERGVAKARELIAARQYVLDSQWGDVQPTAAQENAYLERHSWDEYAGWFVGLTEGPALRTFITCPSRFASSIIDALLSISATSAARERSTSRAMPSSQSPHSDAVAG